MEMLKKHIRMELASLMRGKARKLPQPGPELTSGRARFPLRLISPFLHRV